MTHLSFVQNERRSVCNSVDLDFDSVHRLSSPSDLVAVPPASCHESRNVEHANALQHPSVSVHVIGRRQQQRYAHRRMKTTARTT